VTVRIDAGLKTAVWVKVGVWVAVEVFVRTGVGVKDGAAAAVFVTSSGAVAEGISFVAVDVEDGEAVIDGEVVIAVVGEMVGPEHATKLIARKM
jgi:hypothetical protein